jgi:hypothetical protein
VDDLPLAGAFAREQRQENGLHEQHPPGEVGDGCRAGFRRRSGIRPARGDPAQRLREHVLTAFVAVGTGGPVPAAEGVDQARVDGAQLRGAEAQPLHRARAEVVHQDVGRAGETVDDLAATGRADVEGDAALIAIQAPEDRALAARVLHVHAREIPGARSFDLDDVGAEVAQHLRRARPHLDLREVEDRDPCERRTIL